MIEINPVFNVVLIEWDGNKPPTTWYNRLRSMNLRVMGDKKQSPLDRRACGSGVIYQEGMIMVNTPEQAVMISNIAKGLGAKNVVVGELSLTDASASANDMKVLDSIGKRGRPSKSDEELRQEPHVMTCLWELESRDVVLGELKNEHVCPVCGSTSIALRKGERRSFKPYEKGDIFDYWLKTHFVSGEYEKPNFDENARLSGFESPSEIQNNAGISDLLNSPLGKFVSRDTKLPAEKRLILLSLAHKRISEMIYRESVEKSNNNHLQGMTIYYQICPNPVLKGSLLPENRFKISMVDLLPYMKQGMMNPLSSFTKEELCYLVENTL